MASAAMGFALCGAFIHHAAARDSVTGQFGHAIRITRRTLPRRKKGGGPPFAEPQRPPQWGVGVGDTPRRGVQQRHAS